MNRLRKCVGCGELKPADNMIKLTKDFKSGKVVLTPDSLTFGRSAYLCYNQNCIELALKKKQTQSGFKNGRGFERNIGWKI